MVKHVVRIVVVLNPLEPSGKYVPPSSAQNSAFCLQSVFMCFLCFLQ
jgi:hypothetical protein